MRIIDYYNYIATAVYALTGVAAVIICKKKSAGRKNENRDISDQKAKIILLFIMLVAAFLRLYKLGGIPQGLHQDEASVGYEAYALATYGVDRNGYPFPIYPITWGCGGGSPLLIYINVLVIKLFGSGVTSLRMVPAVFGILTVFVFYLCIREASQYGKAAGYKNITSLFGALFLALCPWHVILSRWSLDSNIIPLIFSLAVYFFMVGIRTKKTLYYLISAAMYALCMYSYGSATIVVPVQLLLLCAFCLKKKVLSVKQLIASGAVFMVLFFPLLVFYLVNYMGLPEIFAESFTINRFTASRSGEVFLTLDASLPANLFNNLKALVRLLTIGDDMEMRCHFIPGYATLFEFTFPVTFLGIVTSLKRHDSSEESASEFVWISALISCLIMGIAVISDISRMAMIFIPLAYFFVKGCAFIFENSKKLMAAVAIIWLLAAAAFVRDYFKGFNQNTGNLFMPGYGEAIARAYEIAGDERTIYSTYDGLSAPFMLALYYTDYDVTEFTKTVVYKDPDAPFRIAESFGNFIFGDIPEDITSKEYDKAVFVVSEPELSLFEDADYFTIENMGNYSIVYVN